MTAAVVVQISSKDSTPVSVQRWRGKRERRATYICADTVQTSLILNTYVIGREITLDTSNSPKPAGGSQGNTPHERDGVPDEDTRNVEAQMSKGDLEKFNPVGHQGSKDSRDGPSDTGTKSQRKHLLKTDDSHTDQWGEGGRRHGRGLDQHGDEGSNKHCEVSVDVGGLVDDTRRNSHEHLLQDRDETNEAHDQHDERKEEANTSGNLIVGLRGSGLEEGGARVGLLVTCNKSNIAGLLGRVGGVLAGNGVVRITAAALGNILDDVLVGLDDLGSERRDNLLDGAFPLLAICHLGVTDHGLGEVVEVAGDDLDRQQNSDREEVEHVVDSGSSKGTLELVSISHLSHGNDGIGDGGSDVGSHDHVDGLLRSDGLGSDQRHDDGRGGRGGLQQHGGKDTDHEGGHGVGVISKEISGRAASDNLGGVTQKVKAEQEEIEEKQKEDGTDSDVHPLLLVVDAACLKDLLPSGIIKIVDSFFDVVRAFLDLLDFLDGFLDGLLDGLLGGLLHGGFFSLSTWSAWAVPSTGNGSEPTRKSRGESHEQKDKKGKKRKDKQGRKAGMAQTASGKRTKGPETMMVKNVHDKTLSSMSPN